MKMIVFHSMMWHGYKIYDLIDNHVSTKSYTIKKPTKVCSWKFTENKIQEIDVDINADI